MYGNPIDRTFVMESVSDVKAVIRNFNDCPITKRHILASNIKKAFNEFGMKQPVAVEENNMILNYLKQDYVICNETKDKKKFEMINEAFFKSKDTQYINTDKFNSGEYNICFITGISGSGKSTLSDNITYVYKAEYIELDWMSHCHEPKSLENIKKGCIAYYDYIMKHPYIIQYAKNNDTDKLDIEYEKFIKWIIKYASQHKDKKFIVEGIQIYEFAMKDENYNYIKNYPLIILNTSALKSMVRRLKRNKSFKNSAQELRQGLIPAYKKMDKELDILRNHVSESFDAVEEKFEPDKALVWLDKPIDKLLNKTISLYHGTENKIKGRMMKLDTIAVGATKYSDPRWSKYYWDNFEYAVKWAIMTVLLKNDFFCYFDGQDNPLLLIKDVPDESNEEFIKAFDKFYSDLECYVYEIKVKTNDIEIGSTPAIKEYVLSKEVPYYKCHIIKINSKLIKKYCKIISQDDEKNIKGMRDRDRKRGPILNHILSDYRDRSRNLIFDDITNIWGEVNYDADLKHYRKAIHEFDKKMKKEKRQKPVSESFNFGFKKMKNDKESIYTKEIVNSMLLINEDYSIQKYFMEFDKYITSMKNLLKKEVPGCKFIDKHQKLKVHIENGYKFYTIYINLFDFRKENFQPFIEKSRNKNVQNIKTIHECINNEEVKKDVYERIIKPFISKGFKYNENYGVYSKYKNGKPYITLDVKDEIPFKIKMFAEFVTKVEEEDRDYEVNHIDESVYNISEIEVDELKYKTYENINDVLSKLEPITESDLSYEQVVNSSSFPDTELTKKIKKLCVRNEGEEIITNLSDIDIFKIKAKLLKTSPGSVKVVNDNDTTFAVIENQTFTIGKINDKEYVLINDDMKYKKLYIDEVINIKSIEELKKNMG